MKDSYSSFLIITTMRFHRSGKLNFTFLIILFLDLVCLSLSQNCGAPAYVAVAQDGSLRETLDTGQHITAIKVINALGVTSIHQNPPDFTRAIVDTESSSLSLVVGTPLRDRESTTSFIDKEKVTSINVTVVLECSDRKNKNVTFNVPIIDENTQPPKFAQLEYFIEAEPCLEERCTLMFKEDILVMDEDRDEQNAEMEFSTNSSLVHMFSSYFITAEPWYNYDEEHHLKNLGYKTKVRLEIGNSLKVNSVQFKLTATNKKDHVDGAKLVGLTTVNISFRELPDRYLPPLFDSPIYYMYVQDSSKRFCLYPHGIKANVPGSDYHNSVISYSIVKDKENKDDQKVLKIDPHTGEISFYDNFGYEDYLRYRSCVLEFVVMADRQMRPNNSDLQFVSVNNHTAELIVFFPENKDADPWLSIFKPSKCNCSHPVCPPIDSGPGTTTTERTTTVTVTVPTNSTDFPNATESIEPSTTTEFWNITTELPDYNSTEYPVTTTEFQNYTESTEPTNSTMSPPPVRPPGQCTCDCKQFSCKDPMTKSEIFGDLTFHTDPNFCQKYHMCKKTDSGDYYQSTYKCPQQTVFCPNISECLTVDECLTKTGSLVGMANLPVETGRDFQINRNSLRGAVDDSCSCCLETWPGEPENLCNVDNYMELIEDPDYCDVFHQCQAMTDPPDEHFIDYTHRCPDGLIYCPDIKHCSYPDDPRCSCTKSLKYCDVYEMGKWKNFDIFEKRFVRNNQTII